MASSMASERAEARCEGGVASRMTSERAKARAGRAAMDPGGCGSGAGGGGGSRGGPGRAAVTVSPRRAVGRVRGDGDPAGRVPAGRPAQPAAAAGAAQSRVATRGTPHHRRAGGDRGPLPFAAAARRLEEGGRGHGLG